MTKLRLFSSASVLAIYALATGSPALAKAFDIPPGDLKAALNSYASQAGVLVVSSDAVNSVRSGGARGDMSAPQALAEILRGTGFVANQTSAGQIEILKQHQPQIERSDVLQATSVRVAAAAATGVETVVVTSSKIKGDIQTVPIAITALSQEQLTSRQIAGGPDLVKEVPNLTFSKTNFTGYNIQIRGIGTQAISVTTDPAVAVALNDIPFLRNHFFEQEFFDVNQVRGRCADRKARSMAATRPRAWSMSSPPSPRTSSRGICPPIGAITPTAVTKACSTFPSGTTGSICAWPANGPSAHGLHL